MTSSIARTVQGVSKEDQASLQGVRGLDRLCRVYGSAEYLEKAMSDWSDDVVGDILLQTFSIYNAWLLIQYSSSSSSFGKSCKTGSKLGGTPVETLQAQ